MTSTTHHHWQHWEEVGIGDRRCLGERERSESSIALCKVSRLRKGETLTCLARRPPFLEGHVGPRTRTHPSSSGASNQKAGEQRNGPAVMTYHAVLWEMLEETPFFLFVVSMFFMTWIMFVCNVTLMVWPGQAPPLLLYFASFIFFCHGACLHSSRTSIVHLWASVTSASCRPEARAKRIAAQDSSCSICSRRWGLTFLPDGASIPYLIVFVVLLRQQSWPMTVIWHPMTSMRCFKLS